jgi:peptidylprolyl isomerase
LGVLVKRGRGGVKFEDIAVGIGAEAVRGSVVDVSYDLALNRGELLQSERCTFRLGERNVIAGLEYGVEGMRVGGERRLRVSPHLAYRENGIPERIPANAVLVMRVTLLNVELDPRSNREED